MTRPTRSIADLRREYALASLDEAHSDADPIGQFLRWFDEALIAELSEPNAMTLATVDGDGLPDARVVLLKGADPEGFCFYTNYHSAKGRQLAANGKAALVFFWPELQRQIRIRGAVQAVEAAQSEAYFRSRPRGSQLGALTSRQSEVVADRASLEARYREAEERYQDAEVPRPTHWGGYRLQPMLLEFWQGRPSRLHDRLRYRREGDNWLRERLEP